MYGGIPMSMIKDSIYVPVQEEMHTAHLDKAHVGDIKGAWGTDPRQRYSSA